MLGEPQRRRAAEPRVPQDATTASVSLDGVVPRDPARTVAPACRTSTVNRTAEGA